MAAYTEMHNLFYVRCDLTWIYYLDMAAYIEVHNLFYVRCDLTWIYYLEMAAYIEMHNLFYVRCDLTTKDTYYTIQLNCILSPLIYV